MKAGEVKPCGFCGKGVMHAGLPLFYRVKVEIMGIDVDEVRKVGGMEQFMGGHVRIARALYDPEIANPIGEATTALVCGSCVAEMHPLAVLVEAA